VSDASPLKHSGIVLYEMAEEEREYVWDEEIAVPVHLIQYVDEGVRSSEKFPANVIPDLCKRYD
jgi:hypothetical protein